MDGEDYTFCRRARAAGFPVHVHGGVRIGHVKTQILVPAPSNWDADNGVPPLMTSATK